MKNGKKRYTGIIIGEKMDKSRVAKITYIKKHPVYGKYVKRIKKFMIHDEENKSHVGDTVIFEESTPISKRKKWRLIEITAKGKG